MPRRLARRVLFRVDASADLGTGHLVRCLALAEALRERGFQCAFVMTATEARYTDRVRSVGHPVTTEEILQKRGGYEWVVLDHYELGEGWLTGPTGKGASRLVIDDLENRFLPCEVLVNASPLATREAYRVLSPFGTRLLLGTRFALLRSAFQQSPARSIGGVRKVLISLGGGASQGVASMAVEAVRRSLPAASIDVVLGDDEPLSEAASDQPVTIHRSVEAAQMAHLLSEADLGIGAGGTSVWERCIAGLPSISMRLAPNQDRVVAALVRDGVTIDGGPVGADTVNHLEKLVGKLAGDAEERRVMSTRGQALVDGMGTRRVATVIDGVRLRRAKLSDAKRLFTWANDSVTRSNSFSQRQIGWDKHIEWLTSRLSDPDTLLFVGSNSEGAVGQIRFDVGDVTEVSISVAPEWRGVMIGSLLIDAGLRCLVAERGVAEVVARVRQANDTSRRLFEAAGFVLKRQRGDQLEYVRKATLR